MPAARRSPGGWCRCQGSGLRGPQEDGADGSGPDDGDLGKSDGHKPGLHTESPLRAQTNPRRSILLSSARLAGRDEFMATKSTKNPACTPVYCVAPMGARTFFAAAPDPLRVFCGQSDRPPSAAATAERCRSAALRQPTQLLPAANDRAPLRASPPSSSGPRWKRKSPARDGAG